MAKTVVAFALILSSLIIAPQVESFAATGGIPHVPDAGVAAGTTTAPDPRPVAAAPAPRILAQTVQAAPATPARLSIPSISLNNNIVPVGTNSRGEMDVPSGSTQNVGWYAAGTKPGDRGSAVIAAHVFAAFKHLSQIKVGDNVYVTDSNGTAKRFVVTQVKEYALAEMSADDLFNRGGGRHLHLITCAGDLTPDGSTYDRRTVVYATLAE